MLVSSKSKPNNNNIIGGSYASLVKQLKHPYAPSFDTIAKGIVMMLETNHFDAAAILTHTLADLMDDFCVQQQNRKL